MSQKNRQFKPVPKKITTATWSALSIMAALSLASQAVWAQAENPAASIQKVEITGSSIKRIEAETALPIQIISRKEIERTGATTSEQLLSTIAANTGFTQESASLSDKPGSSGMSGANLRGLGVSSTLVLLNGRRMASFAFGGEGTDLNSIPLSAIDRVEVLTDGASAVYGADAVGGVINFITRKDYKGVEVSVSGMGTQEGGASDKSISLLGGIGNLSTDGYNIFASASYKKNAQLRTAQRDFAVSAWRPLEARGYPDNFTSANTFPAAVYSLKGTLLGNPSAPNCAPPSSININGECRFDYQAAADLYPESEKTNIISRASLAINADHTLVAEYTFSRNDAQYRLSPTGINGRKGSTALTYPSDGPFYPASYVNTAGVTVATDGKPFNTRLRLVPGGARTNGQVSDQQRLLLGSEGVVAGWDYNTAYAHSESQNTQTLSNGYYDKALLLAAYKTGKINPFGAQNAEGMALLDSAERNIDGRKGKSTTDTIDGRITREIAQLPAGGLGMAAGFELRREALEDNSSDEILAGTIYSTSKSRRVSESRDVKALFAEFDIPLIKNLNAQVAVRYDSYGGTIGSSTNPKVALRYQPTKQLLLRASYGTGFRAPTMKDLDPSAVATSTGGLYIDTIGCATYGEGCFSDQIPTTEAGNPNLKPEKSKQFSLGFMWEPIESFSGGMDFWSVKKTDVIKFAPETLIDTDPNYVEKSITRDSFGAISNWALTAQNQGSESKSGLDINMSYRLKIADLGKFTTRLTGTLMTESEQQFAANSKVINNLGKWGFEYVTPKWRHRLSLDWDIGNWSATLGNTFQSSYEDQQLDPKGNRPTVDAYSLWDMQAGYYGFKNIKLSAGVQNLLNTKPPFSNQTLTYFAGYDSTYVDPRGRAFYARMTYVLK
ncbi:TonB-dependent receptor plug domain-containing protein [Undibacterium parvum]|uniref:TonB-dependent receptor n=1 Tax=Undibacterium parvum TaxID=401471 RepID=A0A3Q9BNT8_9BURK|nr:TonB-dependent receptor [Undibacterium parvum]AZP11117.1 TonB-dependent receptor [Undibacterium parvum]